MPPNDRAGSVEVEARSYSYDAGPVGPPQKRAVAVEVPVQIVIGASPFAVMMATPCDLEDFAYGFALTEGIADRVEDIRGVEIEKGADGWRIALALTGEKLQAHLARKRLMSGRTGCGLCGIEDISQMPSPRRPPDQGPAIEPASVGAALAELELRQPLNSLTRAVHGAAWCGLDGRIVLAREDVGRHNALDKTIGALWRSRIGARNGFFVITSRCSFEMVAKAAVFGAGALVSLSAPTSLALEKARQFGVALIAVARADKAICFATAQNEADGGMAA
jgi:FdhD protein